jgi:hypothetical protein
MSLRFVLWIKIVFTVFLCVPLLTFRKEWIHEAGIPGPEPVLFARLLGAAFLALLVGYIHGLLELNRGADIQDKDVQNVVRVGIVSNGLACLILLWFAGEWMKWNNWAPLCLGISTFVTGVVALGLAITARPKWRL